MSVINVYVNEVSAKSQFVDDCLVDVFERLFACLKLLNGCKNVDVGFCFSSDLFTKTLSSGGLTVEGFFNQHKDFKKRWQLYRCRTWNGNHLTNIYASYKYNSLDVLFTSVSEVYEQSGKGRALLVNFENGGFSEPVITVSKNNVDKDISSFFSNGALEQYLVGEGLYRRPYDDTRIIAPIDSETVLADKSLFELTTYPLQHGRKVYRRIGTDELWYIDNMHYGKSAHCEVFSESTKRQIGESGVNDIDIRPMPKSKQGRTINI